MKKLITLSTIIALLLTGCSKDPIANFAFSPANPYVGEEVFFDNISVDAESFEWNFDDGTTSSVYDPVHTFMEGGTYAVQLKAFGKRRGVDIYIEAITVLSLPPTADFSVYTYLPTESDPVAVETDIVFVGEQVEFSNYSENATAFTWDFGDGYSSELASPVYSYDEPGVYTVKLSAFGAGTEVDNYSKTIEVVEGVNSALRITVLDVDEDYKPVFNASVILFETYDDWYNFVNELDEVFTSPLGKCVYEGLDAKRYYVDAWVDETYNNSNLGVTDAAWIETQVLEVNYIHDFYAYIEKYDTKKGVIFQSRGTKRIDPTEAMIKKSAALKEGKINKFSKAR